MSRKPVTKAVIAAAGFGTRFLPQTKAMPKEMLPLIDKPVIQYIVEHLVAAGIKDIIIVGSTSKRAIEDHFDLPNQDLLANLREGGDKKQPLIDKIEGVAELANFIYVRQKGPYGTATPVMNAAHLIGDEPFIYAFADDITINEPNAFKQMIDTYQEFGGSVLPCMKITSDIDFSRYGVLAGEQLRENVMRMSGVIEKPGRENAPSDFASVGGYLFTPEVFGYIEQGLANLPEGKEFYATDSLVDPMVRDGHEFYGLAIEGKRYDTGSPLEYLKTVVDFTLMRDDLRDDFMEHLRSVVGPMDNQ